MNSEIDVKQSIKESLKEVKLMREGKIPKPDWREMISEVEQSLEEDNNG